jgi:type IV secretory pathway TraG/TraD family ATPase VirD4
MIWRTGSERRTISWVTIAVMVGIAYFVVQGINAYVITIPSLKVGFILMGILVALMWIPVFKWHAPSGERSTLLGSARLGDSRELAVLENGAGDLLVGRAEKSGRLLRQDGPAHLVTIAPTRSGKGVGTILPNLLTLDRAIVCIDPKGENARVAARARGRVGQVHCLDPFGVSGRSTARYNPSIAWMWATSISSTTWRRWPTLLSRTTMPAAMLPIGTRKPAPSSPVSSSISSPQSRWSAVRYSPCANTLHYLQRASQGFWRRCRTTLPSTA